MNKLIGISPRIIYENNVRKQFLNERYLVPLINYGFNTIILTTNCPNLEDILNLCDGFLIPGGDDISPEFYHEKNEGKSIDCDLDIDIIDKKIIEYCITSKKPLLGICRGLQAINVFLGGNLYQDIGKTHQNVSHNLLKKENNLIQSNNIIVNSHHHQAIKDLANDLQVIFESNDGIIEAVIHKDLPILGVQWHPEMDLNNSININIFDIFNKMIINKK